MGTGVSYQQVGGKIAQCPSKLNFGCGYDKRDGYLNVDVDAACAPDLLIVDGDDSAIPRRYFSEVLAKDVLENVPLPQTLAALLDFADYLVLGGKLIIQTSNIQHPARRGQASRSKKLRGSSRLDDLPVWKSDASRRFSSHRFYGGNSPNPLTCGWFYHRRAGSEGPMDVLC
jgi:hypothetical protein